MVKDIWITDGWAEDNHGLDGDQELTMELLVKIKNRPPSRKTKFCTEILKLRPQKRLIAEHFGVGGQYEGLDYVRYAGVRRDESKSRRNTPFEQWDGFFDCRLVAPLADWTKKMCFDYVEAHGEPVNPLYRLGCNRVGCMPCIESGKEEIANMALRFPDMVDRVEFLEANTGKTFMTSKVPGMESAGIRDVVEWAKTSRGGRQQPFPIFHEREACESKYGLCE
jgi:3'-phosphoadenosine 5'-phosphosulfate sulfotransferase (PAPS reductase)/FAD synthetase